MKTTLALAFAIAVLHCGVASAQGGSDDGGLKGLPAVNVWTGDPDADAAACGITKNGLDAAIRRPLSGSKLQVRDATNYPPLVFAYAQVARMPSWCTASVAVQVKRLLYTERSPGGQIVLATVWERRALASWPQTEPARMVEAQIESFTKQLIADWLKANGQ
jgi:hypothetical protein